MNFIKRAMYAVTRKKGQTIILFVIFLVIANLVLTGISIKSATNEAGRLAREKLGGSLTLSFDTQKAMQNAMANASTTTTSQGERRNMPRIESQPVTEEMASKIAALDHILDYNYIVNTNAMADGFTAVSTSSDSTSSGTSSSSSSKQTATQQDNQNDRQPPEFGNGNGKTFTVPDVSITGVRATQLLDTFDSASSKLTSGRHITEADKGKNVVMIEKNLASLNNIKVGDKIKLKPTKDGTSVSYTVVGIYEATTETSQDNGGGRMGNMTFTLSYNKIYMDYGSALTFKESTTSSGGMFSSTTGIDSAEFYIDDPVNMDSVKAAAAKTGIDFNTFKLDTQDQAYSQMMGPINNVASFSVLVVILVGIAGAVILALILMLSIRERTYETGVLLSMGEARLKVIGQYLTEVLVVAIIAFAISIFTGNLIADKVGNMLVQKEITTQQQQTTQQAGNFGNGMGGGRMERFNGIRNNNTKYTAISEIDVKVEPMQVIELYGLGFLIIIAATIIPAVTVMRYNPKTILTKAI